MRSAIIIVWVLVLFSCSRQSQNEEVLQKRIDSLQHQIAETYKPGFGELMSSIQSHHAKLWFAGQNQNWKLADFEIHEIMEELDDIKKFETERKESKMIDMINPALDSVNSAITHKNMAEFKTSYNVLTNTCNKCHQTNDFEFNIVKVPGAQQFSNQDFNVKK